MNRFVRCVCAVLTLVMALSFSSCEEVSGTFVYQIGVSDDTSVGASMTFQMSGAQKAVLQEVEKVAAPNAVGSYCYNIEGDQKNADKAIKAAVNKGMDKFEASSEFSALDLSGCTVVIRSIDRDNAVIFSRTYKKVS